MKRAAKPKPAPVTDAMVRINIIIPESERIAFDKHCRYGGLPKMSMNARLRQLIAADTAGKIELPRVKVKRGPKKDE